MLPIVANVIVFGAFHKICVNVYLAPKIVICLMELFAGVLIREIYGCDKVFALFDGTKLIRQNGALRGILKRFGKGFCLSTSFEYSVV
jgi:hypothetical protein